MPTIRAATREAGVSPWSPPLRSALDRARFRRVAVRAGRLQQALDEQRQHGREVVYADQHPAELPYEVAENAQHESGRANEHHQERSADGPQRVDEGLERDRHESQRKGQEETENHL